MFLKNEQSNVRFCELGVKKDESFSGEEKMVFESCLDIILSIN